MCGANLIIVDIHALLEYQLCMLQMHKIRLLRERKKLTQRQLASEIGKTQSYLSRLENGVKGSERVPLQVLLDIARALKVKRLRLMALLLGNQ